MRVQQLRHADCVSREHHERLPALALPDARHRQALHRRRCRVCAAGGGVEGERRGGRRHIRSLGVSDERLKQRVPIWQIAALLMTVVRQILAATQQNRYGAVTGLT